LIVSLLACAFVHLCANDMMAHGGSPAGAHAHSPDAAPWAKLRLFVNPDDDESIIVRFWTEWAMDEAVRDSRREFFDMMVSAIKRAPIGCVSFMPAPQKWWVVKGTDATKAVIGNFHELGFKLSHSDMHRIFGALSNKALASQSSTHTSTQGIPSARLPESQGAASSPRSWESQMHSGNLHSSRMPEAERQVLPPPISWGHTQMPLTKLPAHVPQAVPRFTPPQSQLPSSRALAALQQGSTHVVCEAPRVLPAHLPQLVPMLSQTPLSSSQRLSALQQSAQPAPETSMAGAPWSPPLPHVGAASGSSCSSSLPHALEMQRRLPIQRSQTEAAQREVIDIPDSPEAAANTAVIAPVGTNNPTQTMSSSPVATTFDTSSAAQPGADSAAAMAPDNNSTAQPGPSSSVGEKRSVESVDQRATSAPECTICMDAVADTVFVPCGHLVSCGDCAAQLKRKPCPVCRKKIKIVQKVFMS